MRLRTDWHRWAIDEIAHPLVGLLDHGSGDGMNKMLPTGRGSSARSDAVHSPQHHSGTRTSPNPASASTGHPYAAPSPLRIWVHPQEQSPNPIALDELKISHLRPCRRATNYPAFPVLGSHGKALRSIGRWKSHTKCRRLQLRENPMG